MSTHKLGITDFGNLYFFHSRGGFTGIVPPLVVVAPAEVVVVPPAVVLLFVAEGLTVGETGTTVVDDCLDASAAAAFASMAL